MLLASSRQDVRQTDVLEDQGPSDLLALQDPVRFHGFEVLRGGVALAEPRTLQISDPAVNLGEQEVHHLLRVVGFSVEGVACRAVQVRDVRDHPHGGQRGLLHAVEHENHPLVPGPPPFVEASYLTVVFPPVLYEIIAHV